MSVDVRIVSWRDIPAQVKVGAGRTRISRPLGERFQHAIDEAAMRAGKSGSDEYLTEWRTSDPETREGEPDSVAAELWRRSRPRTPRRGCRPWWLSAG